jgi:acetoin utilization deacetylase AcuC-like enzyme
MVIITDERCMGYYSPGHVERPQRIRWTLERLRGQKDLRLTWSEPMPVETATLERAHSKEHLGRLKAARYDFDSDTPAYPGIFDHARRSVGGGLRALKAARDGEIAFSLLRPPGHHAMRERAMGFCYLSSVAITTLEALATGVGRIGIFDFDVHHGNGTESILMNKPGVAYYSVHQYPCYPGTGTHNVGDNCFNYPVSPLTPRVEYRKVLGQALADLARFKPEVVAVSAGFDAYVRDPIAQELLEADDFHWIGAELRKLGLRVFSVLEGGYSEDLPELILAYLKGLDGQ